MISNKAIKECVVLIFDSFGWELRPNYIKALKIVLIKAKTTDEELQEAVTEIIYSKMKSDFYGYPAPSDWLDWLGKKPETLDERATRQAEQVFSTLTQLAWKSDVTYDCPVTNWVIANRFGGLSKFRFMFAPDNPRKENIAWQKKEFITAYIAAANGKKRQYEPLTASGFTKTDVMMIGEETKCLQILNTAKAMAIENRESKVIEKLAIDLKPKKKTVPLRQETHSLTETTPSEERVET